MSAPASEPPGGPAAPSAPRRRRRASEPLSFTEREFYQREFRDRTLAIAVPAISFTPGISDTEMQRGFEIALGQTTSIVVASKRMQAYDLEIFRHLGFEPTAQKILVVKSTCHFRADFEPIGSGGDDAIAEQIRVTILHEFGHHFGLDEDRLGELGYD